MPRRNQGTRLRWCKRRHVWDIHYRRPDGRRGQRSTATADREEAEKALAEFISGQQRRSGPRDPSQVLITDLLADYAEEQGPHTAAPERIAFAIVPLGEFWEGRAVGDITRETCRAYSAWRQRSAGTVRKELGTLRAAVNHAHREGRLTRSVPVHLPEKPDSRIRWLTREEALTLRRAAMKEPKVRGYLPLFLQIGLTTGRRKEAILSLRWAQVDLEGKRIDFDPVGRRRTNKRRGVVPIPPKLLPYLKLASQGKAPTEYVIQRYGKPLDDIKKGFAAAIGRAGLDDEGLIAEKGKVTPHTLRHTCATWLMQAGVDKFEAAGFLAMTMETLERNYAHHHPDYLGRAASAL